MPGKAGAEVTDNKRSNMKIIKEGNRWWVGQIATCQYCGTQVEIDAKDVTRENFVPDTNVKDSMTFKCPTCGNKIVVTKQFDS
jgi:DNA-directed RNA polymerase subunit RPC12/RpoP